MARGPTDTEPGPDAAWYQWQGSDLVLRVRAQPRARRDGFAEPVDGAIKVLLNAPPVDGKANARLRRFLADAFGVRLADVELLRGERSRVKQLLIRSPKRRPAPMDPPGPTAGPPGTPAARNGPK